LINYIYFRVLSLFTKSGEPMNTDHLSRLKRLKSLADRGVGGEKENATVLFEKLCKKYQISPEQIESPEEREMRWFKHKRGELFQKLMCQCIYKIGLGGKAYTHGKNRAEVGIECTTAEAIEIELDYKFYESALEKEMERLYNMFIQKNGMFPRSNKMETTEPSEEKEVTEEDILLYRSIKRQTRVLQIEK
jgi:hypothetical protein